MNERNKHFELHIKLNLLSYLIQYRAPVLYVCMCCDFVSLPSASILHLSILLW